MPGYFGGRSWSEELELEAGVRGLAMFYLAGICCVFLGTDPTIANKIKGLTGPVPNFLFFVAKNKNQPPRTVDDRSHISSIDRRPVL